MLTLRVKEISIHGRATRLYSLDGKLWFSKPADFTAFKNRKAYEKATTQTCFGRYIPDTQFARFGVDFW